MDELDTRALLARHLSAAEAARVLDALGAATLLLDADGRVVAVNETWRALLEQLVPDHADGGVGGFYADVCEAVLAVEADRQGCLAGLQGVLQGALPGFRFDYALMLSERPAHFRMTLTPLLERGGVLVTHLGVTDVKEAEGSFEQLLESPMDALVVVDARGVVQLVNARAEALFGYTRAELVGGGLHQLLPERFRARHAEHQTHFFAAPHARPMGSGLELFARHKSGTEFPVEISLTPLETAHAQLVVAAVRDMSGLKRSEASLEEAQARARLALEVAQLGTWQWHPERDEVLADARCREICGLGDHGVLTLGDVRVRAHPDDWPRVEAALRAAFEPQGGGRYAEEFRFLHPDGAVRWVFANGQVGTVLGDASTMVGTVMDITARKQAETALQEREARYRTLFGSVDQGFCIFEMLFDAAGDPVDYRFLEVNGVFEQQTGLTAPVGKTALELVPGLERRWIDLYGRVALTGEPLRFTDTSAPMGRTFDVYAVRVGGAESREVALLFTDITERKRREASLALLAEVSQDLVLLSNIEAAMDALGAKIGEHFNASICGFSVIDEAAGTFAQPYAWHREGVPSILGEFRIDDYHSEALRRAGRAGETYVVCDTANDPRVNAANMAALGVGSFVSVPLLQDGAWRFSLTVCDAVARDWTAAEIDLMRELTDRIWARLERARAEEALRESEEKFRTLFETIDEGFLVHEMIRDEFGQATDFRLVEVNSAFTRQTGLGKETVGKRASEFLPNLERFWTETFDRVARTGIPERVENYNQATGRWYNVHVSRFGGSDRRVAVVFNNITERKRRELNTALLDDVGKELALLSAPDEIMQAVGAHVGEFLGLSGCYFVDADEARNEVTVHHGWAIENVPSLKHTFKLEAYLSDDFIRTMRAGGVFTVRDTAHDARADAERYAQLGVGSFVTVPFHQAGRYTAHLAVTTRGPRDWRGDELELLKELANRVFPRIERARAEARLRASEGRLRALIDNLPSGAAFVVDRELRYLFAGGEALRAAGLAPEDLLGKPLAEALDPELVATYEPLYRGALNGEGFVQEHEAHRRSFVTHGVPVRGADGQVETALAVSYDITERKRAEESVRRSEQRLRLHVRHTPLAVIEWRLPDPLITAWNPAAERIFGYRADEVVGRYSPNLLLAGGDPELLALIEGGSEALNLRRTTRNRTKEGRLILCEWYTTVLTDGAGRATGVAALVMDVTTRQRAVEALLSAQDEERTRISRDLHDGVGQALTALGLGLKRAQESCDAPQLGDLKALVAQTLEDVRRISRALRPALLDELGLEAAIKQFARELSERSQAKIDVLARLPGRLPRSEEAAVYRVVQEALTNVARHAHARHASVVLTADDERLHLIVEDDGVGFATSEAAAQGGVGLLGMRERIELLGGTLRLESTPGRGTIISVRLPLRTL